MDTQTQRIIVELDMDLSPTASCGAEGRESDAERSNRNIMEWTSYLPPACVRAMIAMGWDFTT